MDIVETPLSEAGSTCRASLETLALRNTHDQLSWPTELLTRFDFWAEEAGLFADGRQALEYQIRRNPKVNAMIRQFLDATRADTALLVHLEDTHPHPRRTRGHDVLDHVMDVDSDDEVPSGDDLRLRIRDSIVRLIRLTRQMRQHLKVRLDYEADLHDPQDEDDKALMEGFSEHIIWKLRHHPKWKVEDEVFRDRLQETMLRRGRRILFYSTRAKKRAAPAAEPTVQELPKPHDPKVLGHRPTSSSGEVDVVIRPVRKAEVTVSGPPKSLQSTGMTIDSTFKPHEDQRSVASTKRTKSLLGVQAFDFPKVPAITPGFTRFMCPLCDSWQPSLERERKHWQSHVLRDLAPYICLYVRCSSPHAIYRTSKEWLAHMDTAHKENTWLCRMCECEFGDEMEYREHVSDPRNHDMDFDLSPDEITMLVKMNMAPSKFSLCYFCSMGNDEEIDMRLHMAEHLRNFALTSIPWFALPSDQSDNDSKSALAGARSGAGNSSTARMEDFVDEEELHFDDGDQAEFLTGEDNDLNKAARLLVPDDHERDASIVLWNQMQPQPRSSMPDPNLPDENEQPIQNDALSYLAQPRSSMLNPNLPDENEQPFRNDPLSYLDQIKTHYAEQPAVYESFLDIMDDLHKQTIDTPGVIGRVSRLFAGNPQLIQAFNAALPYLTVTGVDTGLNDPDIIRPTTPMGTTVQQMPRPKPDTQPTGSVELLPMHTTDNHQYLDSIVPYFPDSEGAKHVRFRLRDTVTQGMMRSSDFIKSIMIYPHEEPNTIINKVKMAFGLFGNYSISLKPGFGPEITPAFPNFLDGMVVDVKAYEYGQLIFRTPTPQNTTERQKNILFHLVDPGDPDAHATPIHLPISPEDTADSILAKVRAHSGWWGDIDFLQDGISFVPTFENVREGTTITALGPILSTTLGQPLLPDPMRR